MSKQKEVKGEPVQLPTERQMSPAEELIQLKAAAFDINSEIERLTGIKGQIFTRMNAIQQEQVAAQAQ